MRKHLAIFKNHSAEKVLTGEKKIDVRLSKINIPPFKEVAKGDIVWMRQSGQKLIGSFIVDRVIYYDHPTKDDILRIYDQYGRQVAMDDSFWENRQECNYLTLIFIGLSNRFLISPTVSKRDRRCWVVL